MKARELLDHASPLSLFLRAAEQLKSLGQPSLTRRPSASPAKPDSAQRRSSLPSQLPGT
jgi:hypothetical protein